MRKSGFLRSSVIILSVATLFHSSTPANGQSSGQETNCEPVRRLAYLRGSGLPPIVNQVECIDLGPRTPGSALTFQKSPHCKSVVENQIIYCINPDGRRSKYGMKHILVSQGDFRGYVAECVGTCLRETEKPTLLTNYYFFGRHEWDYPDDPERKKDKGSTYNYYIQLHYCHCFSGVR